MKSVKRKVSAWFRRRRERDVPNRVHRLTETAEDDKPKDLEVTAVPRERQEAFIKAVISGDIPTVRELIPTISDLDVPYDQISGRQICWTGSNSVSLTPLSIAVKNKDFDMAKLLLQHGASPHVNHKNCIPPLNQAMKYSDPDEAWRMTNFLLKHGADPNKGLLVACRRKLINVIPLLIEWGADVNFRHTECSWRGAEFAQSWARMTEGFLHSYEMRRSLMRPRAPGFDQLVTCLMMASETGHTSVVKELIAQGANVDATDNGGNTALHYASRGLWEPRGVDGLLIHTRPEVVQVLVDAGADVRSKNIIGRTALDTIFLYLKLSNFDEFLHYGNAEDRIRGYYKIVQLLVGAGCPVPTHLPFLPRASTVYGLLIDPWIGLTNPSEISTFSSAIASLMLTGIGLPKKDDLQSIGQLRQMSQSEDTCTRDNEQESGQEDASLEPEHFDIAALYEWLNNVVDNGYSLQQLCVMKLRQLIRPPLVVSLRSDSIRLPTRLKASILLQDIPTFTI